MRSAFMPIFCKSINEFLENNHRSLDQIRADQKEIGKGLDDLCEGIQKNTELVDENIRLLQETRELVNDMTEKKPKKWLFRRKNS